MPLFSSLSRSGRMVIHGQQVWPCLNFASSGTRRCRRKRRMAKQIPPNCDGEVYREGEHLFTAYGGNAELIENWVKLAAKESGQRIDWHYIGGRAVIKCIGDRLKAKEAIERLKPEAVTARWVGDSTSIFPLWKNF